MENQPCSSTSGWSEPLAPVSTVAERSRLQVFKKGQGRKNELYYVKKAEPRKSSRDHISVSGHGQVEGGGKS